MSEQHKSTFISSIPINFSNRFCSSCLKGGLFLSPFGMLFHNFRPTIIIISNLAKENNNYDYCWLVLEV